MEMILDNLFLLFILVLLQLPGISTSHVVPQSAEKTRHNKAQQHISPKLFNSLEELARIVDIAYCVGNTGVQKPFECLSHCSEFKGFELITTWHTGPFISDSCGYIALSHPPSPKRIIVAFRGTYSITDTIIDLSAYPQEYVPYNPGQPDTDTDGDPTPPPCTNCSVHAGFMAAWRTTRPTVLDAVSAAKAQYPEYSLVLVGHSLGGAVAALAGAEMQLRGWDSTVTTFGEPKVGNKEFVKFLDATFHLDGSAGAESSLQFRRVTHADDPIPLLPLGEWGYEMHAGEIFISRVDLPPSVEDVVFCEGDHDERCISGADSASLPAFMHGVPPTADEDGEGGDTARRWQQQQQEVLAPPSSTGDNHDTQTASRLPWNLVPSRFRLWELFFAHRDYFLRVGLCVPGGGRW